MKNGMKKATHNGHCQACGRVQAASRRLYQEKESVAKHGYQVAGFGFFAGTCSGSDKQPLEHDDTYNIQIVASLRKHAEEMKARAVSIRCGTVTIDRVTLTVYVFASRKYEDRTCTREEYETICRDGHRPLFAGYRTHGDYWDSVAAREPDRLDGKANMALHHASRLEGLRRKVHGQPLLKRDAA